MIALDANVLVYAHRRDAEFHPQAEEVVRQAAESPAPWAIPFPCLHEFLSVVTNPRGYQPASTPAQALRQVDAWLESPSLRLLAETRGHYETLRALLRSSGVRGPVVHDARVAVICLDHGVSELITLDRDFGRFPALRTRSLLAG